MRWYNFWSRIKIPPASDGIITMQFPLEKNAYTVIISVYAPTMTNPEENKDFYSQFREVLSQVPKKKPSLLVTLMLELNVSKINGELLLGHMGWETATLMRNCYWHCAHSTDWSSPALSLCIRNTKKIPRCIIDPCTGMHLLDYVITGKDQNDVKGTRVMRGLTAGLITK